MAYKNKQIKNPLTGQSIQFLQTSADTEGELLEMETVYNAGSLEPPAHYHPCQDEFFTVLSGSVHVRLNGVVYRLMAGEQLFICRNTVHAMWNPGNQQAVVNWRVEPALSTEYLLETGMGLACRGAVNKKGQPSLLQAALLLKKYANVYRLGKPAYFLQRLLWGALAPVSKLAGYKAVYEDDID